MLIITRWRPVALTSSQGLDTLIEGVQKILGESSKSQNKIAGHQHEEHYYNEVGPEFVVLQRIDNYSVLDAIEADSQTTEFGLRLMKLGFAIHSVEHLRDLSALTALAEAHRALK